MEDKEIKQSFEATTNSIVKIAWMLKKIAVFLLIIPLFFAIKGDITWIEFLVASLILVWIFRDLKA